MHMSTCVRLLSDWSRRTRAEGVGMQTFGRGVLCNWLVCLAVWQATAASSVGGKAIAVWFPISAFVAMGLEVSIC